MRELSLVETNAVAGADREFACYYLDYATGGVVQAPNVIVWGDRISNSNGTEYFPTQGQGGSTFEQYIEHVGGDRDGFIALNEFGNVLGYVTYGAGLMITNPTLGFVSGILGIMGQAAQSAGTYNSLAGPGWTGQSPGPLGELPMVP